MKMTKMIGATLVAFALASQAQAAEKFKVGYLRVMDDAQAIVAQEAGYYKKQGLDVELVEFKSGTDLIKAIVGGQLDIGVLGFTNAVAWASKGADLKVVGGAQQGYHSLIVRDDSGIKDIAGLKGKTPEATISAMLAVGSKPGGPFTRVDKGTYTLANALSEPNERQKRTTTAKRPAARKQATARKKTAATKSPTKRTR